MTAVVVESLTLVSVLMAILWGIHLALRNAAIVDAGWAAGLPLIAVFSAWRLESGSRGWLLAAMIAVWGARLSWHLLRTRVIGQAEEGRYVELRRSWKTHLGAKFFVFFQAQALLDVLLSVPIFVVAHAGGVPGLLDWIACGVWALALLGEWIADHQLDRFKADPRQRGRVCTVGLWRYSRHPNYFFEWFIWVSYALYASAVPFGWLAWTAPALILFFLLRFTGIPATEAQALRSRGDAYRQYQRETNAFVPWFPRLESK